MSRFGRFEFIEPNPSSIFLTETSLFAPKTLTVDSFPPSTFRIEDELDLTLDLFNPKPIFFDGHCDFLLQLSRTGPFYTSTQRVQRRVEKQLATDLYFKSLSDRVSALELGFDSVLDEPKKPSKLDRKYTWTAEIKAPEKNGLDRKYELTTEIKGGKKTYKWTAEIKGKCDDSPISRKYSFEASTGNAGDCSGSKKKEKQNDVVAKKKKKSCDKAEIPARVIEIEEPNNHGVLVLRQAFAKRATEKSKGKRKELSPQDAAMMIQMGFRAYLLRRSQALRALRELAVAKAKLKEIRALFHNFMYLGRLSREAEEKQKFSERIIVLLLTVDAIEGADLMVRAAKRSMVDELEAMLDVVDPQPQGTSLSMKRRTFDMPDGVIQKELAAGVAQVVQMLDEDADGSESFGECV